MNIIINFIYGFTILLLFIPSHAPAMMRHMQEQATEPKLELWHNDQKIAEIPASVAKNVSPVFKQQLCGSKVFDTRLCPSMEMKQDKVTMGQDSLKIDVDEFDPETVTLFTRMVNAPTALANQQAISAVSTLQVQTPAELQKMLVNDHSDLVLDLYGFLAKYEIDEYMPLLAEQFVSALASTSELYNRAKFPFAMNNQLHLLSQTIRSLSAYGIALVQEPYFIKHTNWVNSAVFSPDGKHVVTASRDTMAKIYDITAQKVIHTIQHTNWVNTAVFSPDGKYVVTTSDDDTVHIYDIGKKEVIGTIAHTDVVNSAVFSPDGKYVVTASADDTAYIYDIAEKRGIDTIPHTNVVISAQFSLDSKYVVTASVNHTAKIYDIGKKQVIGTITHAESVTSATFSPDGKHVVTTSWDKTAKIYDIATQQVIGTIAHTDTVNSAVFSPDGKYVVTASRDGAAHIYDIAEKRVIDTIAHTNWVNSATFSPDGRYVVTASDDCTAKICDIATQKVIGTISHTRSVNSAVFSPDGRYIITASNDRTARITPLNLDMQVITIATLIDLAKHIAGHESVEPLVKTGWLYKEFKKLSDGEQDRLFAQFPHIKQLIDTAKDENEGGPVHEQNKKRSREQDNLGKEDDLGKAPEGKRKKEACPSSKNA